MHGREKCRRHGKGPPPGSANGRLNTTHPEAVCRKQRRQLKRGGGKDPPMLPIASPNKKIPTAAASSETHHTACTSSKYCGISFWICAIHDFRPKYCASSWTCGRHLDGLHQLQHLHQLQQHLLQLQQSRPKRQQLRRHPRQNQQNALRLYAAAPCSYSRTTK